MASGETVKRFPVIDVSDSKPKCTIFLEVPGLKTERQLVPPCRIPKNAVIKPDIQENAVNITVTVTTDDKVVTYEYKRNMPENISKQSKVEVEKTQLKLTLKKDTPAMWTQFTNYLSYREWRRHQLIIIWDWRIQYSWIPRIWLMRLHANISFIIWLWINVVFKMLLFMWNKRPCINFNLLNIFTI